MQSVVCPDFYTKQPDRMKGRDESKNQESDRHPGSAVKAGTCHQLPAAVHHRLSLILLKARCFRIV